MHRGEWEWKQRRARPASQKHMAVLRSKRAETTGRSARYPRRSDPALKRRGPDGQEIPELFFLSLYPRRAGLLLDLVRGLVIARWGPRSR